MAAYTVYRPFILRPKRRTQHALRNDHLHTHRVVRRWPIMAGATAGTWRWAFLYWALLRVCVGIVGAQFPTDLFYYRWIDLPTFLVRYPMVHLIINRVPGDLESDRFLCTAPVIRGWRHLAQNLPF